MAILLTEQKNLNGVIVENLYHDSKSLAKTSYNYSTNQLTVTFQKGNVYAYHAVPINIYESMKNSTSAGSYFQANIAKSFTYLKKGDVPITFISDELFTKLPTTKVNDN